jgi:RND superfamily putative drug exporter
VNVLARLLVRMRWAVVVAWCAGTVAATVLLPDLGAVPERPLGGLVPDDAEPLVAERRALELFGYPLLARTAVVQHDPAGLTEGAYERAIERAVAVADTRSPAPDVELAVPVANVGLGGASAEEGTAIVTYLLLDPRLSLSAQRDAGRQLVADARPDDAVVGVTGPAAGRLAEWDAIAGALPVIEVGTLVLVALVLALSFRSVGAPLITLAAAAITYLLSVRLAAFVGSGLGITVPREIEPVMVALLLGIVTDYAVFMLAGMRRRLAEGSERRAATEFVVVRTAPIVVAAGAIVCLGAAALVLGRLDFFRSFGPALAVTVVVAVVVSVTFVPAVLAIGGSRLFWPSLHRRFPADEEEEDVREAVGTREPAPAGRLSVWLGALSARRRGAAALGILAVALLIAGAAGLRELRLGFTLLDGLPASAEARRAADAAQAAFAPGILSPTVLLVEGERLESRQAELERLRELLGEREGVAAVLGPGAETEGLPRTPFIADAGTAARMLVVLAHEPLGADALDTVRELDGELELLLDEAGLAGTRAALTGDTALAVATVDGLLGDMRRVVVAAVLANLLLLALFLRALVAPLYLLAASALALAAALGLTTFVFQGLLGYDGLTYYVPFAAAVLLLSLGSDYNLFVVGRVWQSARNRSIERAIAEAVPRASRAITIAGIALAASFGMLALVPLRAFRELAFVMAVGILLDTFVVRTLLVPALVTLVGERSWWPGRRRSLRLAADRHQ